jgi:hypothetical protein
MLDDTNLQSGIERAHFHLLHDPKYTLRPIHRYDIYRALFVMDTTVDHRIYKRLAIATAQFVLPVWQQAWPTDDFPSRVLNTAESLLSGTFSRVQATVIAEEGWEKLEQLGYSFGNIAVHRALYAGNAAVEALFAVLDRPPFNQADIGESDTDADLDPWSSDTALWAVTAYSGGTWEASADLSKRQEFWSWWLKKAIPTAWHLEN